MKCVVLHAYSGQQEASRCDDMIHFAVSYIVVPGNVFGEVNGMLIHRIVMHYKAACGTVMYANALHADCTVLQHDVMCCMLM